MKSLTMRTIFIVAFTSCLSLEISTRRTSSNEKPGYLYDTPEIPFETPERESVERNVTRDGDEDGVTLSKEEKIDLERSGEEKKEEQGRPENEEERDEVENGKGVNTNNEDGVAGRNKLSSSENTLYEVQKEN